MSVAEGKKTAVAAVSVVAIDNNLAQRIVQQMIGKKAQDTVTKVVSPKHMESVSHIEDKADVEYAEWDIENHQYTVVVNSYLRLEEAKRGTI